MPKNLEFVDDLHSHSLADRLRDCSHRFQAHWYLWAGQRFGGLHVLDVGAANGYGIDIMHFAGVARADGVDIAPLTDYVQSTPLKQIPSRAYDAVTAIDVLEHVHDDEHVLFLQHCLRITRRYVFVVTPNWCSTRATNPWHVREYTPEELKALLTVVGMSVPFRGLRWFTSGHTCEVVPHGTALRTRGDPHQDVNMAVLVSR